jgi:tRNA(fMet)-specific endonuclease VapC
MLDTSAYSALGRGQPAVAALARSAEELHLNPIVVGELLAGFSRGSRRRTNEADLRRFLASPRAVLDPVDRETADRYSAIWSTLRDAGTPIPTNDIWIAASAWQHGLRLLTLDRHYQKIPQILLAALE